jgi:hypothetical protein
MRYLALALAIGLLAPPARLPDAPVQDEAGMHRPFDQVLDLYVRDGLVYYRALQIERGRFDAYVRSLDVAGAVYDGWARDEQAAFWVNAYNAFVLRTVINAYPIRGRSPDYPPNSIRQIPGAFERIQHRAAGRRVTLDEIEKTILPGFEDPRLLLALGRGAIGSTRLRSEAITAARLARQLEEATREFATRQRHIAVDPVANRVGVSPIIGWNEARFVAAYGGENGGSPFASRSPVERAVLSLIAPHMLPSEREFLNRNEFEVRFMDFDWRLNDLGAARD